MAIKRLFIPLLAVAIGAMPAMADDAFDKAIDIIVSANPQAQSERDLARAVALDNADGNSLANPEVSFARVWGRNGIGNKLQLDVSQSFDWPGLYGARRKANASQRSAAELLCQWTELDVASQAKQLLLEFVFVKKQMEMTDGLVANVQQLGQAVAAAQKQGYATELDLRKITIEEYKLSSQAASLSTRLARIEGELLAMCGGKPLDLAAVDAYPIERTLTLEEYMEQIAELDPQIAAASMSVQAESLGARAANLQRFPGFSVGYQHQAEMGDRFNGFTVGMSLPFFENRHARSAALARADAARAELDGLMAQKQAAVASSMAAMIEWWSRVDHYNAVFGDNAYLTLIKKAYDGGELSIIEYISEVNYYAEATQAFLEAEYNYRSALAELNKYDLIKKQ